MEKLNDLDNTTKGLIAGVGAAALLGIAGFAYFLSSEEAQKTSRAFYNRQRAKHLINKNFDGNKKAKKMIDKMPDAEINGILAAADKASNLEGQLSDAMSEVGNYFKKGRKKLF